MTQSLRRKWVFGWLIALVVTVGSPPSVFPGGLFLTEIGTNDVGLAGAGWAARAQDPATLFRNPAGMSLLEGNQTLAGAQLLYGNAGFSPGGGTTGVSGSGGGNPIAVFPGASGFYTHSLGRDVKVGFGVLSNFGLGIQFDGDWVGRYYLKQSVLVGVSFVPAASYRVNEWLSIGGGLNIMVAELKYVTAINNAARIGDGQLRIQDVTAGVGGQFGVMVEPKKGTRVGVTYYSPVTLDFGATPSYQNLGPGVSAALNAAGLVGNKINLGLTVPQHVIVSAYHELTDRLALMGDFGWEDWSRFGKVDVSVNDTQTSLTTNIPYQDTYHVGTGAQYRVNSDWLVNAGFAYDTSMVKDADRTVSLPVGATYKFGLGAEWQATQKYNVGFNYELTWVGDLPVTQQAVAPLSPNTRGTVIGEYKNANLNFFAVNVKW